MSMDAKKQISIAIFIVLSVLPVFATISNRADAIIKRAPKGVDFSVKILRASDGLVVYRHAAYKPTIPASNMKIVTTAAALHYLTNSYMFQTHVALRGNDLIVIGGGDPLLGDPEYDQKLGRSPGWIFEDILSELRQRGIQQLENIYIDSTFFNDNRIPVNWPSDQLDKPYAAEVSGLNYNANCLRLFVSNSKSRISVSVQPKTKYVKLVNQVKPTSKGSSAVGAYRNSEPNKWILKGVCRKGASFDVAIERPAAMFAVMLYEHLARSGIKISGKLAEKYVKNDASINIIKTYKTPLEEVLIRCNKDSLNMAAECLVKTISAENTKGHINGEWPHGLQLIQRHLEGLGINSHEFKLDDGSGLSRENRLSANALVTVLYSLYKSSHWSFYEGTLAIGGEDGTLNKYFREGKYKGKIIGKTGYIDGVRAFSGLCRTPEGDYLFSILTTGGNSNVRGIINSIAKAIIDETSS